MSNLILDMPAIEAAALRLERGELVAFPTETVYGLGADAENPIAVAKIYAAKGRPANHPVIVHLPPGADLTHWAQHVPSQAHSLIHAFWPGPLTLILQRALSIPDAVSGGQATIGVRCPSHPVAQALLKIFKQGKGGIAAPSANRFGRVSPTTAQHVHEEFNSDPNNMIGLVECILDGGQSEVGIESTIVDLSRIATHGSVLLRPGFITASAIEQVIGAALRMPDAQAPRVSGSLDSHYAPHTPLALVEEHQLAHVLAALQQVGRRAAVLSRSVESVPAAFAQMAMSASPQGYAHDLYAALRAMDAVDVDIIVVTAPPHHAEWDGVNDRLQRAAFDSVGVLERMLQV